MKKENYLVKVTSLILAAAMLMAGCGSADRRSDSGSATTAADAGSETYAPASDGAASDNAGYAYEAAEAEADADYGDYTNGIKGMETQSATATDGYLESCYDYDDDSAYFNTEEYSQWEEQGFSSVLKAPLSTFAADVDTASYSNLRRLINSGYGLDELPQGAARIEEMINYFSYDYNAPKGMEPFGVTTQISECPWNDDAKLLMIGLKTEDID